MNDTEVMTATGPNVTMIGWTVFGFAVYGLARIIADVMYKPGSMVKITDLNNMVAQAVARHFENEQTTPKAASSVQVNLNTDAMDAMYDKYGKRGVYAYLVMHGIAKDALHGEHIIEDVYLPQRAERAAAKVTPMK